jgi:hypothetical protein
MRFEEELAFLENHGDVVRLKTAAGGEVIVSPQYQGRVMTSAVSRGADSLGWINRKFIEAGEIATSFDNYGGEDRFWLGPEGGQFSIFFSSGQPFIFDAWRVPSTLQEGAWDTLGQSEFSVLLGRKVEFTNYSNYQFALEVRRRISLLGATQLETLYNVQSSPDLDWIAFESDNTITNIGGQPWRQATGLLSIWILGMFMPKADTQVIIPYETKGIGPIVNDRYFGVVPSDRLKVEEAQSVLVFKCDGQYRSKIGLSPTRAKSVMGSYSESARLLTVVHFDRGSSDARYVNSLWEHQSDPFNGDVINSFNDGPVQPGQPSQGGFYELESSSPAGALEPGEKLRHRHRTFHFVGDREALNSVALASLGVSLDTLSKI